MTAPAEIQNEVSSAPDGAGEAPSSASGRRERRLSASEPEKAPWWRRRRREGSSAEAPRPLSPGWAYSRSVLTGIAVLALGFTALLVLGSPFQAARDQKVLYDDFRQELAEGVAPVGPLTSEGAVLPNGSPVAILTLAGLGRELVVVEGTTSGDTMSGPGHRRDTVLPGQAGTSIIFGRQSAFGGFFQDIGTLPVGSEITTITGQGFSTYKVEGVRRAGDPQPQPLQQGKARLTLVSAEGTPYLAESTVRVDATLVSTSEDGESTSPQPFTASARLVTPTTLPASERPMGSDTSQAFALVLWSQLFLLAAIAFAWARVRWGRWQAWAVGVPVMLAVGWAVSTQVTLLLPNLL